MVKVKTQGDKNLKLWLSKRRSENTTVPVEQAQFPLIEKFGENLTPNMRALRLAMTIADQLLSMGVSANSVVAKTLDITETYCQRPVHIDISANVLMVSQLRGIEREPLTLIRPVTPRDTNYMTIQSIQNLIYEIHKGQHSLDEAEQILDDLLKSPRTFPWWLIMFGNASIVAGVTLMYTSAWEAILTTFCIGMMIDRLLALLIKHRIPPFFRQVAAAGTITVTAALINFAASQGVSFFFDMNPTLLVVGGVVMLVAGLVIVAAVQDAIEEYYLTANARLTKVIMQTVGIVMGILVGLYAARKLGIGIAVSPDPLTLNDLQLQVIGAAMAAGGYALACQTKFRAVAGIGIIGGAGLFLMWNAVNTLGISVVPASGIAAAFIGIIAAFISRFWHTPSVGIIAGSIVPLVPGLMLYNGLMQLINYPPGDPEFFRALGTLFTAATTALAIAAGASFGGMIGRPINQKIAYARNDIPFAEFMRRQINPKHKVNLANLALSQLGRIRKRREWRDHHHVGHAGAVQHDPTSHDIHP
ncbi:TPA: hypothetical protein DEW05_05880 [Candidatus Saccharibacteria bacterium]|nr:hypothetical protein [Candidatus Saccharibacteria bacterium]